MIGSLIANSVPRNGKPVLPHDLFPCLPPPKPAQTTQQVLQELLRGTQVLGKHPEMKDQPEAVEKALRDFAQA